MGWKYVVLDSPEAGDTPVLFPPWVQHSDVAGRFPWKVLGAGFVRVNDAGEPVCYGKSTSLGTHSRPEEDTEVIRLLLACD